MGAVDAFIVAAPPDIGTLHKSITAVGSRVTCRPAPMNTDQDWLVLIDDAAYNDFAVALIDDGWIVGGSLIPNDANYLHESQRFNSFTKGIDNVIATASAEFHGRFLSASSVAKRLNLLEKADRIALFQAVLYATVDDALPIPPTAEDTEKAKALESLLNELAEAF